MSDLDPKAISHFFGFIVCLSDIFQKRMTVTAIFFSGKPDLNEAGCQMSSIGLIEEIKNLVREDKIIISKHAYARMVERDVLADDLVNLILNGEIIESYPDDFPCPSVLMFGFVPGKACHVVVAKCLDYLRVVTVYLPDEDKWINCRERVSK